MGSFFDLFRSKRKKTGKHEISSQKKEIYRKNSEEVAKDIEKIEKHSFSKVLLIQESLLIWIHTLAMLVLAFICVFRNAYTELPWLTAMVSLPWAAYAISQHAYYRKSAQENIKGGIVYETAMAPYSEYEDCR